ncbi:hypothetical protein L596_024815 [Steinernema carpocapsae]|uniref:Uncharacterized protein n=1 Tax=Steinernema carpocapsae TaxID=34508 RepID=A0A4U5M5W5_STECR|nr:hypothetical protein L596_024815 [Steinernema carpocapsae]
MLRSAEGRRKAKARARTKAHRQTPRRPAAGVPDPKHAWSRFPSMKTAASSRTKNSQCLWFEKIAKGWLERMILSISNAVFDEQKPQGSAVPRAGAPPTGPRPVPPARKDREKMAGTFDPNYQTIAGIIDCFDDKTPAKPTGPPPVAPPREEHNKVVSASDPNYQTIAGIADCFVDKTPAKASKPTGPLPVAPPREERNKVVHARDPNYQTIAGLTNDCFVDKTHAKPSRSKPAPVTPVDKKKMAKTHNPNHQTMQNINNEIFGRAKRPFPAPKVRLPRGRHPSFPWNTTRRWTVSIRTTRRSIS